MTGNDADPNGPVLLLIDVQQAFDDPAWGERNNPDAEASIESLLGHWREQGWPIAHAKHNSTEPDSPLRPGSPGNAFKSEAEPREGEPVFEKSVNSAFIGTDLESWLHEQGAEEVVLVGLTTDHCVSTTTRMAENLGFDPVVVSDATATFDREAPDGTTLPAAEGHRAALAHLNGEFARIVETNDLLD